MGKNQWVVHKEGKWYAQAEGEAHSGTPFATQHEAIAHAREAAKREKSELIIQDQNGAIREKNSYGNDPRNVKG